MVFGLLRDIMDLLKNPPKNLAIRSKRRLRTRQFTTIVTEKQKDPFK